MKQINLIPWREQAREQLKREFFNILAAAMFGSLLLIALFHFILSGAIQNQENINNIFQQEITALNQQLIIIDELKKQQQAIAERINIIDKLQVNRSQTVNIFTDFVKTLPQGVYLTSIKLYDNNITVTGKAESNARISMFMRNLELLSWLEQSSLTQIQTNPKGGGYNNDFVLDLKMKPLHGLDDLEKKAAEVAAKGNKLTKDKPGNKAQPKNESK